MIGKLGICGRMLTYESLDFQNSGKQLSNHTERIVYIYIYIGFRGSAVFVVTARLQCLPCLSRDLHMQDLISKAGEVKASSALNIFSFLEGLYTISYYIFPASLSEIKCTLNLSNGYQVHCTRLQRFLVWQLASWGWLETWISTMITSCLSNTLRTRAEQHVTFERWFPDRMRVIQ